MMVSSAKVVGEVLSGALILPSGHGPCVNFMLLAWVKLFQGSEAKFEQILLGGENLRPHEKLSPNTKEKERG